MATAERTLIFAGEVNSVAFEKLTKDILQLVKRKAPIEIILNSPGGNVVDGYAIYDLISSLKNHVTIRVLGEASSMGSIILQAGDRRVIAPNAVLMLHEGHTAVRMAPGDLRRYMAAYEKDLERMYAIFSENTGQSVEHFKDRMKYDWYLSATEALSEGLVDAIE